MSLHISSVRNAFSRRTLQAPADCTNHAAAAPVPGVPPIAGRLRARADAAPPTGSQAGLQRTPGAKLESGSARALAQAGEQRTAARTRAGGGSSCTSTLVDTAVRFI